MAVDDINFDGRTTVMEQAGSASLNAPNDILIPEGIPTGLIDEIAAGSLNPLTDIFLDDTMWNKEIKLPDSFAF